MTSGGPVVTNLGTVDAAAVASHPRGCLVIGDSITLMSITEQYGTPAPLPRQFALDQRPVIWHAQSGRPSDEGLTPLLDLAARGWVPPTVCWLLGMNDTQEHAGLTYAALRYALKRVGGRTWWVATIHAQTPTEAFARVNTEIRELESLPGVHVYDWAADAAAHPEWMLDNVHPNHAGRTARTCNLLAAMRTREA